MWILGSWLFLGQSPNAQSAIPVPVWQVEMRGSNTGSNGVQPIATRVLADGTTLIVVRDDPGVTFLRYGQDGALLSSPSLYGINWYEAGAAIDAFGAVFVAEYVGIYQQPELRTMKYDGASGRKMWPAFARHPLTDHPYPPPKVEVAPDGDALVVGGAVFRYAGGTGLPRWGPISLGLGTPISVVFDAAGDIALTGTSYTADTGGTWATWKISSETGATLWGPIRLGVPDVSTVCPGSCFTPFSAKSAFDSARNLVLTVSSFQPDYDQVWLTIKYDGFTGDTIWGPVVFNGKPIQEYESPMALALDASGDVVVVGGPLYPSDPVALKYDGQSGELVWGPVSLAGAGIEGFGGLVGAGNGDPVVVGTTGTQDEVSWNAARLNGRNGSITWQRTLVTGDRYGWPASLDLVGNGTAVLVGSSSVENRSRIRTLSLVLGSGATLWERLFGGVAGPPSYPVAMLVDDEGNSILVASFYNTSSGGGGTVKYAASTGAVLWGPVPFADESWFFSQPIAATLDVRGDVIVTGQVTDGGQSGAHSFWHTVKYDGRTGQRVWGPVLSAPPTLAGPAAVAADSNGNAILTGQTGAGWVTFKYAAATGDHLWGPAILPSPNAGYGLPVGIATDAGGNVVVAGFLGDGQNQSSLATVIEYDGSTGAAAWGPQTYRRNPGSIDQFTLLALDPDGDVVVTGVSRYAGETSAVSYLARFDGGTGQLLWLNPIAPADDVYAWDLVVDANGDTFVTGTKFSVGDWTEKWSANGTPLWEPAFLPFSNSSYGPQVDLDGQGNPIVVDEAVSGGWTAVSYDSATGQPVWGPATYAAGSSLQPFRMSASPDGYVVAGYTQGAAVTAAFSLGLGIATLDGSVPPGGCGVPYEFVLNGANGVPPYHWSVVSGALPADIVLDGSGRLSGAPSDTGHFTFRVRLSDGAGGSAERDLSLDVFDAGEAVPISVERGPYCSTLSAPPGFAAYLWYPGGQTSQTVSACPSDMALYGVVVTEASGCRRQGSVIVAASAPVPRGPIVRAPPRPPLPRPPVLR